MRKPPSPAATRGRTALRGSRTPDAVDLRPLTPPPSAPRRRRSRLMLLVWAGRAALLGAVVAILLLSALGTWRALRRPSPLPAQAPLVQVTLSATALDPALVLLRSRIQGPGVAAGTAPLPPGSLSTLVVTFSRPGTYTLSEVPNEGASLTGVLAVQP